MAWEIEDAKQSTCLLQTGHASLAAIVMSKPDFGTSWSLTVSTSAIETFALRPRANSLNQ
jgi:hypothetical protein